MTQEKNSQTNSNIQKNLIRIENICNHPKNKYCKRELISMNEMCQISNRINKIPTIYKQDIYISRYICLFKNKNNTIKNNNQYFLSDKRNKLIRVCLKTFLAVVGIGRKRAASISSKIQSQTLFVKSKRGGARLKKEDIEKDELIKLDIKSYQTELSHYCRNKSEKDFLYLPPNLNILIMWKNFATKHDVTYYRYKKIFNSCFNLKFRKTRTDICDFCFNIINKLSLEKSKTERKKLKKEQENHLQNAQKFYDLLRKETSKNQIKLSFDMQQTQPLPFSNTNAAYYSRQINLYSVGVVTSENNNETTNFFLWTEFDGRRGANEISSIVHYMIKKSCKSFQRIVLFCDSCPGQNKNLTITSMLLYSSIKFNVSILVYYPVRGHSFIPPDRSFGRFEKKKKKYEMICLPSDYQKIYEEIGECKLWGKNFHFYDWASSTRKIIEKSSKKIPISKVKKLCFHKGKIGYSLNYEERLSWYKYSMIDLDIANITIEIYLNYYC